MRISATEADNMKIKSCESDNKCEIARITSPKNNPNGAGHEIGLTLVGELQPVE